MTLPGSTLPAFLATLCLAPPAVAWAQPATSGTVTEVTLRSRASAPTAGGRVSLTLALGAGYGVAGVSANTVDLRLSGVVSTGSLRLSVGLTRAVALQLGGFGALWLAPSRSVSGSSQTFDLEGASGFGLLGGGVAIGAPGEGLRVSLLGGVAWMLLPISDLSWTRSGAGIGAGAAVELAHHWSIGGSWTLGLGATGWFIAGADRAKWIGDAAPSWQSAGGGLFATVSSR